MYLVPTKYPGITIDLRPILKELEVLNPKDHGMYPVSPVPRCKELYDAIIIGLELVAPEYKWSIIYVYEDKEYQHIICATLK